MRAGAQIAVSLVSADPPLERQVEQARRAGASLIELRVDLIGDPGAVTEVLRSNGDGGFILTIRAAVEGGAWDGDDAERIALIESLGLLNPDYVDVELATWRRSANLRQKIGLVCDTTPPLGPCGGRLPTETRGAPPGRPRNKLILSRHDLDGTPTDLDRVYDELADSPAAVLKYVTTARDAADALRVLGLLHRRGTERPLIALAMGEAGLASRVLAAKFGGFLTFAALDRGGESAPGQPTLDELVNVYRFGSIGRNTRVFGVVGWPVQHSLSPHVHNAALAAANINAVYVPLPVGPSAEEFRRFMDFVKTNDWLDIGGLSVTIPHKQHAFNWLRDRGLPVRDEARRCGAVNTLAREAGGTWSGHNTDGEGVVAALATTPRLAGDGLRGRAIEILGAGGVARAVAAALLRRGAEVTVTNRSPERAAALAAELGCSFRPWEQRALGNVDVLINCTPVGMSPQADETPVPPERLSPGMVALDTVYTPRRTRFLRDAAARGCATVCGVEMFVAQAAAQHELWHGRAADVSVMRRTLDVCLPP
ncbi:MAG: shikimate dehydrogenase [Phycisphaerae bacterium]|jgi:3-dehydroquinate dehydratase/shikimate dehydrogenase